MTRKYKSRSKSRSKSREKDLASVFVLYHLPERVYWDYRKKMPTGWKWAGAGSVHPIRGPKLSSVHAYNREEQFSGPLKGRQAMRKYLDGFFTSLKEKGIIKRFTVRNTFPKS